VDRLICGYLPNVRAMNQERDDIMAIRNGSNAAKVLSARVPLPSVFHPLRSFTPTHAFTALFNPV
jgi:hypothetical protein